jgi:mRNA interferase MazF
MVDWSPGRGSEQTGERPAVIVQNNPFNSNPNFPNTVVVAVSKSGRAIPTHVFVPQTQENGLWEPSYVKCEQIQTITKERLGRRLGNLTGEEIDKVAVAIKRVLALK